MAIVLGRVANATCGSIDPPGAPGPVSIDPPEPVYFEPATGAHTVEQAAQATTVIYFPVNFDELGAGGTVTITPTGGSATVYDVLRVDRNLFAPANLRHVAVWGRRV
jgi:hypothetical protein